MKVITMTKTEIESKNIDIVANFFAGIDVTKFIAEHQDEFDAWNKREGAKYENRT